MRLARAVHRALEDVANVDDLGRELARDLDRVRAAVRDGQHVRELPAAALVALGVGGRHREPLVLERRPRVLRQVVVRLLGRLQRPQPEPRARDRTQPRVEPRQLRQLGAPHLAAARLVCEAQLLVAAQLGPHEREHARVGRRERGPELAEAHAILPGEAQCAEGVLDESVQHDSVLAAVGESGAVSERGGKGRTALT